jgi:hypothetical protein
MLSNDHDTPHRCSTVLFNEQWHKGVVALLLRASSNLLPPTVVLTQSNDLATGLPAQWMGLTCTRRLKNALIYWRTMEDTCLLRGVYEGGQGSCVQGEV